MPTLEKEIISESLLQTLKANVRGMIIDVNHPDYESARKVYNGMIDKRPALIVKCRDAADVMASVNFARENKLVLAIRGGSHNCAGLGSCDGGLVVDLSAMRSVRVDPASRTVRVDGGCLLGDIDHATHPFGLAVPSGFNSTTGIGGLALGGGLGYLTRKFGLTIDSLLEADIVLTNGQFVTVNAKQHEDLFWAIRGGGGNFGVITSFLFKAHTLSTVYGGPMLWPMEDAKEIIKWFDGFIKKSPDEVYGFFAFMIVPPAPPFPESLHMKTMCGIVWCYTGSEKDSVNVFNEIRAFKKPALDLTGPLPVPVIQSMFDPMYPAGMQHYWKADFVNELSDEAIDKHIHFGSKLPTLLSTMHLYPIDGAAARVDKNDTAWNYRGTRYAMIIAGMDPDASNKEVITDWAKDYWLALHPYNEQGAYVNFMTDEGEERVKAAYGDNYDRLLKIKRKYDPQNLFSVNQNIKP